MLLHQPRELVSEDDRLAGPSAPCRSPSRADSLTAGCRRRTFFKHQPGRIELIFNPTTGALLGERGISLNAKRMVRLRARCWTGA
jgi:hypothetical protein